MRNFRYCIISFINFTDIAYLKNKFLELNEIEYEDFNALTLIFGSLNDEFNISVK